MQESSKKRKWCGTNIRTEYAEQILKLDLERPWTVTEFVDLAVKEKLERIYDGQVLQADSGEFVCAKCKSLFSGLAELREHRRLERRETAC